jgi:hypothetical protein|tara:strand:- start:93 stop:617 length:525 start_codon:yes stop_codon:yes gene_type:complete
MQLQETNIANEVLGVIPMIRGMMWEKIKEFQDKLKEYKGVVNHKAGETQSQELQELCPLKQHIEGGLYTREIFMPKGSVVVSMIHKQNHPSFLLKGELSYLTDDGEVVRIKAPHKIFTKTGTQRVLYIHEDSEWCCVYKTEAKTFEEAEADVYTNDYKNLPKELILKNKLLWQE